MIPQLTRGPALPSGCDDVIVRVAVGDQRHADDAVFARRQRMVIDHLQVVPVPLASVFRLNIAPACGSSGRDGCAGGHRG